MTSGNSLPRALEPFLRFAGALRAHGFLAAPEQTQSFVAAVGLLGPRSMTDIYRAAHAVFAPSPERMDEFDALFRLVFHGQTLGAPAPFAGDDDEVEAYDAGDGGAPPLELDEPEEVGLEATTLERLGARRLEGSSEGAALRTLRRRANAALPQQRSRRWRRSKLGRRPDLRRAVRLSLRRDGEVLQLPVMNRRPRLRNILLLIDVSGSMAQQSDSNLAFAHALTRSCQRVETFTLGTRLTRVTRALRVRNRAQALSAAGGLVADWDGGTRLGEALQAFFNVPRFVSTARGAFVVVVSDGLERGGSEPLANAAERLSRLAWSVLWLNPLASDADYRPETEGMRAVLPFVDRIGAGAHTHQLVDEVLSFARRSAA
ncbi:MAG: VWA domain-containing protein [Pseudomonadota bacterium]